ncbi:MAG: transporter substrate-binding protein [Rhodospirillales bacterium]|nr:transporter substrate-binding protein [Rhodospirillales bacterium]
MTKGISKAELKRRDVLRAMAVGGAGAIVGPTFLARPARAAGRTIKIGFVSPETGPIAAFGEADDFILAGVRKVLANGITIAGTQHPVTIIKKDSQSNPNRAAEVTAELINSDKVDLMLGSSTSDTTNPVSDQCELNGVPCITSDAPWQAWFFGRKGDPKKGFDWTYHFFWGVDTISTVFCDLWSSLDTNKTVGALWSNDPDGIALSDPQTGFPPLMKKRGFNLVDLGLYPTMSDDFSAQINKLKEAKVDILTGVFVPPAFATFWTQAAQQGFRPKIATPAKALLFPSAIEAIGDRGIGLSTEVWWSPHHPFKSGLTGETPQQFCDAYSAATGRQWTQPIGFKHAILEVACDVLKRTKKIDDPGSIRDAIAATDYTTIVGPINFAKGPVKNVATTPLVGGQWKKGSKYKYDLAIVNNKMEPSIPLDGKFEPLAS